MAELSDKEVPQKKFCQTGHRTEVAGSLTLSRQIVSDDNNNNNNHNNNCGTSHESSLNSYVPIWKKKIIITQPC